MNLNKIIFVSVVLIAGVFVAPTNSIAGKPDRCSPWPACKDDGGDPPPPPPPPTACTDTFPFPGFVYTPSGGRNTPAEIRLASCDGSQSELVAVVPKMILNPSMHMMADRSKGVLVWVEDPGEDYQNIVRRLDFTVGTSGDLQFDPAVTILPLAGEEALPGDFLAYEVGDVWGDATHNLLYLAISRTRQFNSDPDAVNNTSEALIYDLNELTDVSAGPPTLAPDVRTIYHFLKFNGAEKPTNAEWPNATNPMTLAECDSALYPQFVPTCYDAMYMKFNPSGTRLYLEKGLWGYLQDPAVESWEGIMRIDIDRVDALGENRALADWIIGGPELVYAVNLINGSTGQPTGMLPRPDTYQYTLPDPEIVASHDQFLDADQCAVNYAPYSDGNSEPQSSIWQDCIVPDLIGHTGFGNGQVWESADTYLFDRNGKRGRGDIYRITISGGSAGTEELLIEGGRGMDTGL